ncbi:uncharacterized protein DUF2589 [Bacillus oleivorans]|uniref:Uncharacterized protein DUF2589 n=1 Tax=Bacillus oleivorans TaxID=1448271 RepID=A0A285CJ58_9BACI|nr:DUF2589 domain-containing protein [Bacillus oleivorans]SNX67048.1 uncharacterized protein DUF2589 [Bacillus oleivorans]
MANELVNMGEQFAGLPIETLIATPLKAASDTQVLLAKSTYDFIKTVGFDQNDQVRTAKFAFKRTSIDPIDPAQTKEEEVVIDAPFLSLVAIPNLQVDYVDITFDMEVKSSFMDKSGSQSEAGGELSISGGYPPFFSGSLKVHGSVSTYKENVRTSDNSAKYHVAVKASNAKPSETLMRIMDLMSQAVIPASSTPAPNPA